MKQILATLVAIVLACGMTLAHPSAQPPQTNTIADKKKFLERELPLAGDFSVVTRHPTGETFERRRVIKKVSLVDCQLMISRTEQPFYNKPDLRDLVLTHKDSIDLKQVDTSLVRAREAAVPAGYTASRPSFNIALRSIPGVNKPFSVETEGGGNPRRTTATGFVNVEVGDSVAAGRIAIALRDAAILCGAPDQPLQAAPAQPGPTPGLPAPKGTEAAGQAPAASAKMTNDDVIKMVAAGLSDQVIATSIRQATNKEFDVTPTGLVALKKANVPDAVMVAMLEKGPAPQAPATAEPKSAPKYDANLAKPTPPPAPPREPSNGCESVEAMGLFKNVTGVANLVEWLARIRNNGGVTRIVVYGWTDMYGEDKKGQVQIQGGQIASIRLDLTENKVIPPVKFLRLVSCR